MDAGRPRAAALTPDPHRASRPGRRLRRRLAAAAALVVLAALLFTVRISGKMRDFEVYWTAAARALASEPLYRETDGHFQFKYLPAFAVLAAPAALVPLETAKVAWFAASIALLVALVAASIALLPEQRRPTWWLVAVLLVAMGKFFGHELVLGQVNLLFGLLVVAAALALRRDAAATASALIVAAVVVKPYAVLFLPWVILLGGMRAAVSAAIGALCVALAPVGLYGLAGTVDLHAAWWATVTSSTAPNLLNPDNVSVAAFAAKWLGAGTGAWLLSAAMSAALLLTAAFVVTAGRHVTRREALECALLLTLVPLLSPQGWDYVFLVAAPGVALLANYDDGLPRPLRILTWIALATIGLSLFDIMGRQRYATFMAWSVITACFVVVVGALATLRGRRAA